MENEKRLIDANSFKGDFMFLRKMWSGTEVVELIDNAPTEDIATVVRANWIYYSATMQECSNCKRHTARHKFKYCPHCGATMGDKLHYAID